MKIQFDKHNVAILVDRINLVKPSILVVEKNVSRVVLDEF